MTINTYRTIPATSIILNHWEGEPDYIDSFQAEVTDAGNLGVDDVARMILASEPPKWMKVLTGLRDSLAGPLGLKTGLNDALSPQRPVAARYAPGDAVGFFPVIDRTETEIVMALDDRHLSFRVSVLLKEAQATGRLCVFLTTVVRFHNLGGRLYFIPVKPFHKLIVKESLKRFSKKTTPPVRETSRH